MVDTPIGTNSPNYTLVSGDLGATIYCRVTATNGSGSTNAISNVVGPITGGVLPANAGGANLPNIADTTPEVTVAVSCTTGTWTGDPTILYSYQWKRGGTNVGTDSASYTPVVGDLGATLQCVVTATNGAGSASATSNTTGAVAAAPSGPATTNMWTWLKADAGVYSDAGTTAATNGGTVQQWSDQGGGGRHFSAATSGNRPTFVTNAINTTLPVLRFAGAPGSPATNQYLVGPSAVALTAGEIFIVIKKAGTDPGDGSQACHWDFSDNGQQNIYPYNVDGCIYDGWGSITRNNTGDPTPSLASWRLYNVVSTASEWTSYIDGTQQFTVGSNSVLFSATPNLASDPTGATSFDGDIAEVIMYSAKCSAPDKAQTKSYIAAKYGLTIA